MADRVSSEQQNATSCKADPSPLAWCAIEPLNSQFYDPRSAAIRVLGYGWG